MPLEVSPGPYPMKLPFTPLFDPQTTSQPGGLSSSGYGPAAAGASAIIPPNPGGIANPHDAIPALADAGYTAPQLRSTHLSHNPGGPTQMFPANRSIYAGGSMYNGNASRQPLPDHLRAPTDTGSEGWYTSSLPAPRPAPRLQTGDSMIAPRQHHHTHSPSRYDDDDASSDVSYYARPKHRSRSGSMGSSQDNLSSYREHQESQHRRAGSLGHHHRNSHGHRHSPSGSPLGNSYSPNLPSPLSLSPSAPPPPAPNSLDGRSQTPIRSKQGSRNGSRNGSPVDQANGDRDTRNRLHPGLGPRVGSYESERHRHDSHRGHGAPEPRGYQSGDEDPRGRKRSQLVPPSEPGSHSGSVRTRASRPFPHRSSDETIHGDSLNAVGRHFDNVEDHAFRNMPYRADGPDEQPPRREVAHSEADRDQHHHRRHHPHHPHHGHRHSHCDAGHENRIDQGKVTRRQRRASSVLSEFEDLRVTPRRRNHSHSHFHQPRDVPHPAPSEMFSHRAPSPPLSVEDAHLFKDPYRRQRAVSMQVDGPRGAASMYQTPSVVGGGPEEMYDDGASVAGSAMTFMDGPVAGRTSQYGLPKYAHAMKPDPRRFMVQRGNADVYLD